MKGSGLWWVSAMNDPHARAVCSLCEDLGIDVPDEVAILGVGDLNISRRHSPSISSRSSRPEGSWARPYRHGSAFGHTVFARFTLRLGWPRFQLSPWLRAFAFKTPGSCGGIRLINRRGTHKPFAKQARQGPARSSCSMSGIPTSPDSARQAASTKQWQRA
jgi:hypothetical protein